MKKVLETALERALSFLSTQGLSSITSVKSYTDFECTNAIRNLDVLFPSGLLLHAITTLDETFFNSGVKKLKTSLIKYLKSEEDNGSYNYFTNKYSSKTESFKLPDDVDDMALIASALYRSNNLLNESTVLKLINQESVAGGPYFTWYIRSDKLQWKDVDPVVNAHLQYYLALLGISTPNTVKYLKDCLESNETSSPYYPTELFFYFYLSKFLSVKKDIELFDSVKSKLKYFKWKKLNSLEKILYGLSLNYLGVRLQNTQLQELVALQKKSGEIPIFPICFDYSFLSKKTYSTNEVACLALWVELIQLELKHEKSVEYKAVDNEFDIYMAETKELIKTYIKKSDLQFKFIDDTFWLRFTKPIALTYYIYQDLGLDQTKDNIDKMKSVSVASFFGWTGYTILDELLDEEIDSKLLSVVPFFINSYHHFIHKLTSNVDTLEFINYNLAVTDKYYFEENEKNQFSTALPDKFDFKYIYNRMSGFTGFLSTIPRLFNLDNHQDLSISIRKSMEGIFVIDQMNDDSHDWKSDFKSGILTWVIYTLLQNRSNIDWTIKKLEITFWEETIHEMIKETTKIYKSVYKILHTSNFPNLKNILQRSYSPIEKAAQGIKSVKVIEDYFE